MKASASFYSELEWPLHPEVGMFDFDYKITPRVVNDQVRLMFTAVSDNPHPIGRQIFMKDLGVKVRKNALQSSMLEAGLKFWRCKMYNMAKK